MAKRGRPCKTVENCMPDNWKELILEMSAEGCSDVEIRAHLCLLGGKFCHNTWDALIEREEEFMNTIKKGKVLCQSWWEKEGRTSLNKQFFKTGLWYANMKNRFGWRDPQETTLNFDNVDEHFKEIASKIALADTNPDPVL